MKKILFTSLFLTSLGLHAHAADIIPTENEINSVVADAHDWSGGYWGIHGGYIHAKDTQHLYDSLTAPSGDYGTHSTNFDGGIVGLLFDTMFKMETL